MRNSRLRAAKAFGPVLALLACLFLSSSMPYAMQDLRPLLSGERFDLWMKRWLGGVDFAYHGKEISIQSMGTPAFAEFFVRKSAHLLVYASIGFCLLWGIDRLTKWNGFAKTAAALALAASAASLDEFYQSFVPGRGPSMQDVWLDLSGACAGAAAFVAARKYRAARRPET